MTFKILSVTFLCLFFLFSCKKKETSVETTEPITFTGSTITIGILSEESPRVTFEKINPLRKFISDRLEKNVTIEIARDFKDLEKKIESDLLHLLIIDPATYCELKWSMRDKVFPLLKPEGGSSEVRSVFVTKQGRGIEKIFDSFGKKLALGDEKSSFSYLIPLSMLKDLDISIDDFSSVDLLKKEHRIALSVLIGEHDIGAMSETTANQYLKDGLKIIRHSEPTPKFLIAHTDRISQDDLVKLKDALNRDVDEKILKSLGVQRFSPAQDRDFDYMRVLIRNFRGIDYTDYGERTIKVAVLPLYSPLTIYKRYEPLMRYLSEKTGYEFKLTIPENFEEFIKIVSSGKVHFSYQNPYTFALVSKRYPIKPLAITIGEDCTTEEGICGNEKFRGIIITRKDSGINKVEDLKGKKIMIVSPKSAGGFLSQKIYLEKKGFNINRDFKLIDAKRQEKVIIGVYRGDADAGFVREAALSVWANEVDISKLKILDYGEYLPNWPFAAVNVNNPKLVDTVKSLLTNIDDPLILKSAKIKGFKVPSDEDISLLKRLSN